MKMGEIQTQLAANNKWWRDPTSWQRDDVDLRPAAKAPFHYRSGALRELVPGGLYILRGPRRAGKTTEVKYTVVDLLEQGVPPRNIIHAPVDGWHAADLRTLVTRISPSFLSGGSGTRYWFIDEISGVPDDWPAAIKYLRDNDADFARDTVVLTGSSSARLHDVRKALAGRRGQATNTDRTLLPMRFTDVVAAVGLVLPSIEVVRVRDLQNSTVQDQIYELSPYLSDLVTLWETYLRVGGFPQAISSWLRDGDVHQSFIDAMWDVVHGDAINGARFSASQTLTLIQTLATGLCSPLNAADLARDLDISRETVRGRLTDLMEGFLAWPCHRDKGGQAHFAAQAKWYFTDPVLARLAALRGRGREPDFTQLNQQQIGVAILRNLNAFDAASVSDYDRVLHYRTASRAEIDFVGKDLGEIAVESKYVDDRWGRELQTISASPWFGIVASRSGIEWRDNAWVIPAPMLALLLGA